MTSRLGLVNGRAAQLAAHHLSEPGDAEVVVRREGGRRPAGPVLSLYPSRTKRL